MQDTTCYKILPHVYWLVVSIPLKNMKVNWDDDIPNIWENKSHVLVTTNQLSFDIGQLHDVRLLRMPVG